jgi:NADPH:quinone reductase-like Zn-dependent oxidoreductase
MLNYVRNIAIFHVGPKRNLFMKKITLRRSGGPEVLEVKDGEVLIDIRATGLNWSEIMIRRGDWPIKIQNGFCLGSEGAGVVEKIGKGVQRLSHGDRVALLYVQAYSQEEQMS